MDTQADEEIDAPVDLSEGCAFCGESVASSAGNAFSCPSCFARFTGERDHAYPLWGPYGSTERVNADTVTTGYVDDQQDGQWLSAGNDFFDDDMR